MKPSLFPFVLMAIFFASDSTVAGWCPAGPPASRGDGTIAGVPVAGGTQYYFKDALLAGFYCFEELGAWFPSYFHSSNSISPDKDVVDMVSAEEGTATFLNVVVPVTGTYTLTFRYAFASGLFPGVTDRPEGIKVNGAVVTDDLPFPITGDFEKFENSSLTVHLSAGRNTVQMFNIASASISRADAMTVTPAGSSPCESAPSAPAGLMAQAATTSQVNLNWTASIPPPGCSLAYTVFRSTTAGFTRSGANQIASGLSMPAFEDTTASCGTTYFYLVEAVDSAGASVPSAQATATTDACLLTSGVKINCGGPAVSPFAADADFAGGGTIDHDNVIDLSRVANPAPMAVYQTARVGNSTYTISGFNPGSIHTVRLHFAETYFSTTGSRTFNVSINGARVLSNFDILAAAGGKNVAVIEQFTEPASSTGDYIVTLRSVTNQALVSGIEIE